MYVPWGFLSLLPCFFQKGVDKNIHCVVKSASLPVVAGEFFENIREGERENRPLRGGRRSQSAILPLFTRRLDGL